MHAEMEATLTALAVYAGTLSATALSALAGYALAHWESHKEESR